MARILITGDRGFLGRYLVTKLLGEGHRVVGLDNNSKHGVVELPYDDNPNYDINTGDARNFSKMYKICKEKKIDVIVCNAALIGGIKYFHDRPYQILTENSEIANTAARVTTELPIRQLVMISSSMVYESADEFPAYPGQELEVPPPISAYGFQKLYNEYLCRALKNEEGINYTIVRPFNAVGAGEEMKKDEPGFAHVIPDFIYKIQELDEDKVMDIFGDGEQKRCFTHVRDIADGIYDCILNERAYNESFNFSTETPVTMKELAKIIYELMTSYNPEELDFNHLESFKHDVKKRVGDHKKAKEILGWEPTKNLREILEEMINEVT